MIRNKIFQKYFLLAFSLLAIFVVLGFIFNGVLIKLMIPSREMVPPTFIAKIIDRINPLNKVDAIKELPSWQGDMPGPQLVLLNENGDVLYPDGYQRDFNWQETIKPEQVYDFTYIGKENERRSSPSMFLTGIPLPGMGPGGPREMQSALVRLSGSSPQFLLINPPSFPHEDRPAFLPFIGLASLVLSLLLGIGATIAIIYNSVNRSVIVADNVISELHNGNLKARFPIGRKDEFGQAMMRFNFMADEIEKLVTNLRNVEQARTKLLQELAHDLRTPIASLRSLMETLDSDRSSLDPQVQQELMTLSLKEIDYFGRLVEDLLFLAQVNEPAYQRKGQSLNLSEILAEEADDCLHRYEHQGKNVVLDEDIKDKNICLVGDSALIRRLFRNALENAFSFSKFKVSVMAELSDSGRVHITIEDDGPGFSQDSLNSFGYRRVTRKVDNKPNGRLSVGLGSVVMKTICDAHRGTIEVSNAIDSENQIMGAKINISLPQRT
ncbi:MAG: hypothetical protein IPL83_13400 [Bdellovibrionales bacterium]|nr:hypothetical protein [Bdellovibrionales bacterium]